MPQEKKTIIAIVGAGNVGVALAKLFADNGYKVFLGSRSPSLSRQAIESITSIPASLLITTPKKAVKTADITLLTVPDKFISSVCESLTNYFKPQSIIAHCSGALDSQSLLSVKNCALCSVHPLNTFPNKQSAIQIFSTVKHNTALYYEGDKVSYQKIKKLFTVVGFHTFEISQQAKPLYHAACVFACNYLTVLMDLSLQTACAAGIDRDDFWRTLQPLIHATLGNISHSGTASSLSGPIARGDTQTIKKHLKQLSLVSEQLNTTYADLGSHALGLAIQQDEFNENTINALRSLFISKKST